MKNFRLKGYINVDENGYITLTDSGIEIASSVYERHKILSEWLISIGVDKDIAQEDACRMEHILSPSTFQAIRSLYKNTK